VQNLAGEVVGGQVNDTVWGLPPGLLVLDLEGHDDLRVFEVNTDLSLKKVILSQILYNKMMFLV